MSTHPNAILKLTIIPDDLARRTRRAVLEALGYPEHHDDQIKIQNRDYNIKVMEDTYDEGWQISGKEGEIIIFDLVTYGYGEDIAWEKLEARKLELEQWAASLADKLHFRFKFSVSANYW